MRAVPPPEVRGDNSSHEEVRLESESSPFSDLRFPPTRVEREIDMVEAFIMLGYARTLAKHKVNDVEKVLVVCNSSCSASSLLKNDHHLIFFISDRQTTILAYKNYS